MLVQDFIGLDYSDNLLHKIREQKQNQNESVLQFLTNFEDECSRLTTRLTNEEKVRIIKLNVLQHYRPHIALIAYNNTNELKRELQILETTMNWNKNDEQNRSIRFHSNDRSNGNSNSSQNYRYNSESRSRYDKHTGNNSSQSSGQNYRSYSRNRSHSNSRNDSQTRHANGNNYRAPTPHSRYDSRDRSSSRSQSNERNDMRRKSSERFTKSETQNKHLN